MKQFHEIIRGLREDKDLKQSEIAEIVNCTQQQYSKFETGESEPPQRVLIALAAFHGTSTDYLLGVTKIKDGVVGADVMLTDEYTAGQIVSEMASLSPERRAMAVEIVMCLGFRESIEAKEVKKDKGGKG